MFQDSVPDGSYNDPFLSSVCVCVFDAGFLLFERLAWNETVDLMSHFVGESGKNIRGPKKINRDYAKKAAMSQRCAWKCSCMAGRGSCAIPIWGLGISCDRI